MIGTDERLGELQAVVFETRAMVDAAEHAQDIVLEKLKSAEIERDAAELRLAEAQSQCTAASKRLDQERREVNRQINLIRQDIEDEYATRRQLKEQGNRAWLRNDHKEAKRCSDEAQACLEEINELRLDQQELRDSLNEHIQALRDAKQADEEASRDLARATEAVAMLRSEVAVAEMHVTEADKAQRRAEQAFARRIKQIRRWESVFRLSWPDIARAAGVPDQYVDHTKISVNDQGETSILFGGVGRPDGNNHAHYALDPNGFLYYKRDIGEPHGPQNYIRPRRTAEETQAQPA